MTERAWLLADLNRLTRTELIDLLDTVPGYVWPPNRMLKAEVRAEIARCRAAYWDDRKDSATYIAMKKRERSLCVITAKECNENLRSFPEPTIEYITGKARA